MTPLLGSSNDFLRCYAAASIISPQRPSTQPVSFKDRWQVLVDNGIPPGDAIWMAGYMLKEFIHHQYSLNSVIERDRNRLRLVKSNPESAAGGIRYAEHEIDSLGKSLDENSSRFCELHTKTEQTLNSMAECWPADGLLIGQMEQLANVFVDTQNFVTAWGRS